MTSASAAGIHDLPHDVLFSIFSYLPITDMATCATVCEQWREIVKGFTHLWNRKTYLGGKSPKTLTVLRALPLLQKVQIEESTDFSVVILGPRLVVLVQDIRNIGYELGYPGLRCLCLSTSINILESLLSSSLTLDFLTVEKLCVVRAIPTPDNDHRQDCAEMCHFDQRSSRMENMTIRKALAMCSNVSELSLYSEFLSAHYLDSTDLISQLCALKIECPGLEDLAFLRHCSDRLVEFGLKGCADLPSAAYVQLQCLGKLQRLHLQDSYVAGCDLEVAAKGLTSLKSLQLDCCDLISDLSFLRHCSELEELRVKISPQDAPVTGLQQLPVGVRILWLISNAATADELSEALPRLPHLEELNLSSSELCHLNFLRFCPQLTRLCLEFCYWSDTSVLSELCHLTQVKALDLTRCRIDADILYRVMCSMPELTTLSLSHAENVMHLRFLRHCSRLRSLSLFDIYGVEREALVELRHLNNLQQLSVSEDVIDYVYEIVQPCLPQLQINTWNVCK